MFRKLDMLSAVYMRPRATHARPLVEFKVRRVFLIVNLHLHFTRDFRFLARRSRRVFTAPSAINFSYLEVCMNSIFGYDAVRAV